MRNRFLVHGGVQYDPLKILSLDRLDPMCHRKALLQQRRDLFLAQSQRQRQALKRPRIGTPPHRRN